MAVGWRQAPSVVSRNSPGFGQIVQQTVNSRVPAREPCNPLLATLHSSKSMRPLLHALAVASFLSLPGGVAAQTSSPVDLSREPALYVVGYSHLDTQWRWSYPEVIRRFIPNTMWDNFALFDKYPHYVFNFTGANRYRMMKEYWPEGYQQVRKWVARGRWFPAGSSWEENDVLVPSSESLIRQLLYGHRFFQQEFNRESNEYMLPDCFGFPASLPSILAHCGLRGFSTQKLYWGSAVGIPFNIGVWEGLDGQSVIAEFNSGQYDRGVKENLSLSDAWRDRLATNGAASGFFGEFQYYGVGDRGGAPKEESLQWVEKSVASTGPVKIISARADQFFGDITDAQKARLPKYKGDLLLTEHSAGSLTSQAYMKRWNRQNEVLAEAAEKASVAAHLLGAASYPREKLRRAWELVLGAQFHDIITGTCLPKAYEYSWNDEIIAMNCFASVLEDAVGGVARALDTQVEGLPLVIFNPLSIEREDVVEIQVESRDGAGALQVYDAPGAPVPTQVVNEGGKQRLIFVARVPSIGFAVYSLRTGFSSAVVNSPSLLKATERSLENERYRLTLNDAGDLASILDKTANRELLAAPARLAFLTENPKLFPAWNMDWSDRTNPPRGYVEGPAKIRVVENGPIRVALEVERRSENSTFIQTIRLTAGSAVPSSSLGKREVRVNGSPSDRIEILNHVDWQARACSLKAVFPLTVSNPLATYNWGLGKIQRPNNHPKKYEVPSHQWSDLTDERGDYGVSILSVSKYGSDKPNNTTLRLTLLYTPGLVGNDYAEQQFQDWGRHDFTYALSGHTGDWRAAKSDWQAEALSHPLLAFRSKPHPGPLGRSFSLLRTSSDQVAVRAVKLAEDSDQIIVRLQELNGAPAPDWKMEAASSIRTAAEINGLEKTLKTLPPQNRGLELDFKPYQIRSIACTLSAPTKLAAPVCKPVRLPYNLDIFSFNELKQDGGCDDDGATIPAEMIGDKVVSEGITFRIGPRKDGKLNAVSCRQQTIPLPGGNFNRLYLLAMSINGDTEGSFTVDGAPTTLHIQDWSGYIGIWDNRVFQGLVEPRTYSIKNPLDAITPGRIKRAPLGWFCSHRHARDGTDLAYSYTYLFKYSLDLKPGAKTLTLPDNARIRLIAATAAFNENDATRAAQPLYDDFTGRKPIELRPEPANQRAQTEAAANQRR